MTRLEITIPGLQDVTLRISAEPERNLRYPSARLQKGLCLLYRGQDLTEEAVGFGVPVVKCGLQAFFPGSVELELLQSQPDWTIKASYTLNLVERLAREDAAIVRSKPLYTVKDSLAALIRRAPALRGPLTSLSTALRRTFSWETRYEPSQSGYSAVLVYSLDAATGCLHVETSRNVPFPTEITELVIMNEQGARVFDQYQDSAGLSLSGKDIGCWDEVLSNQASFTSSLHRLRFTLAHTGGARLFRGRELLGSRLAWAGFGSVLSRPFDQFEYTLRLEKVP